MRLHPNDNVGLALTKIKENCSFENVIAQENIPAGHKIALAEIQKGEAIRKYNQTIGFASQTIHAGDHVHTHNIEFHSFERLPEVFRMNEIQYYVCEHDLRRELSEKQNRSSGYISGLPPLFEFRLKLFYVQLEYFLVQ